VAHRAKCADGRRPPAGNWISALALFRLCRSVLVRLPDLDGGRPARLLLFGAVQATMIGVGLYRGERLRSRTDSRAGLARWGGLAGLLLSRPIGPCVARLVADARGGAGAGGVYSLRAKRQRGCPACHGGKTSCAQSLPAVAVSASMLPWASLDRGWHRVRSGLGCTGIRRRLCRLVHSAGGAEGDQRCHDAAQAYRSSPLSVASCFLGESVTLRFVGRFRRNPGRKSRWSSFAGKARGGAQALRRPVTMNLRNSRQTTNHLLASPSNATKPPRIGCRWPTGGPAAAPDAEPAH